MPCKQKPTYALQYAAAERCGRTYYLPSIRDDGQLDLGWVVKGMSSEDIARECAPAGLSERAARVRILILV